MGKKKGKHKHEHKHRHDEEPAERQPPSFAPAQLAGIAAAALKQVDTPAFRQMVAASLGAATQAFDARRAPVPPRPPVPPVPPAEPLATAPSEGAPMPPEIARLIDQVAARTGEAIDQAALLATGAIGAATAALDRWAEQRRAAAAPRRDDRPPDA